MPKKRAKRPRFTAATADRHVLYGLAVQCVEAEIDFVDDTFRRLRRRRAVRLREDFCGTANTCCEWVRRRPSNIAIGLDLDRPTLDWGLEHNVGALTPSARRRIALLRRDVLRPGAGTDGMDVILAMNFSYWIFKTRDLMRRYFTAVRRSLVEDGVFFLDFYGGWEAAKEQRDRRAVRPGGFTYVWDQAKYNPITGDMACYIHFRFADGTRMDKAFSYEWRLWSLPEIRELLAEAGFSRTTVYWEGDDDKGGGNGVFTPAADGEQCPSWVTYITAEK